MPSFAMTPDGRLMERYAAAYLGDAAPTYPADIMVKGRHVDDTHWNAAQKAVVHQYHLSEQDGDRYWRRVQAVYQRMEAHSGSGQPAQKSQGGIIGLVLAKSDAGEHWITIHPHGKGANANGEDMPGRHVLIDGDGRIVGGAVPKSAQGKSISNWWKTDQGHDEPALSQHLREQGRTHTLTPMQTFVLDENSHPVPHTSHQITMGEGHQTQEVRNRTTRGTHPETAPGHLRVQGGANGKYFLHSAYADKDDLKQAGARWDADARLWYAPNKDVLHKILADDKNFPHVTIDQNAVHAYGTGETTRGPAVPAPALTALHTAIQTDLATKPNAKRRAEAWAAAVQAGRLYTPAELQGPGTLSVLLPDGTEARYPAKLAQERSASAVREAALSGMAPAYTQAVTALIGQHHVVVKPEGAKTSVASSSDTAGSSTSVPTLQGSEKQVAWATEIRAKQLRPIRAVAQDILSRKVKEGLTPAQEATAQRAQALAQQWLDAQEQQPSAKWWIDHRQNGELDWQIALRSYVRQKSQEPVTKSRHTARSSKGVLAEDLSDLILTHHIVVKPEGMTKSHEHVGRHMNGRFVPKDDPAAWQGETHRWRKQMGQIGFLSEDRQRVSETEPDGLDVAGQETAASPPRPFPYDVPNRTDAPTSMAASQAGAKRQPLTREERDQVRHRFGRDATQCSFARDKDGVYAYTHRARSKSYPHVLAVPKAAVRWIASTG